MEKYYTIKQTAEFLRVSEKTVRRKIYAGQILSIVQDKKYLINKDFLEKYKKEMSRSDGHWTKNVQVELAKELGSLKDKIDKVIEENQRLQYEVKNLKDENKDLRAIILQLCERMTKALPPPKDKKRWWEFWKK